MNMYVFKIRGLNCNRNFFKLSLMTMTANIWRVRNVCCKSSYSNLKKHLNEVCGKCIPRCPFKKIHYKPITCSSLNRNRWRNGFLHNSPQNLVDRCISLRKEWSLICDVKWLWNVRVMGSIILEIVGDRLKILCAGWWRRLVGCVGRKKVKGSLRSDDASEKRVHLQWKLCEEVEYLVYLAHMWGVGSL